MQGILLKNSPSSHSCSKKMSKFGPPLRALACASELFRYIDEHACSSMRKHIFASLPLLKLVSQVTRAVGIGKRAMGRTRTALARALLLCPSVIPRLMVTMEGPEIFRAIQSKAATVSETLPSPCTSNRRLQEHLRQTTSGACMCGSAELTQRGNNTLKVLLHTRAHRPHPHGPLTREAHVWGSPSYP